MSLSADLNQTVIEGKPLKHISDVVQNIIPGLQ